MSSKALQPGILAAQKTIESRIEILEENKRMSQCLLWPTLERFYKDNGLNAWDTMPSYITNNTVIAQTYAETIIAYLWDVYPTLKKNEPVYIVELASGSGAFCGYFLEALFEKINCFKKLRALNIQYILTDFTERQFSTWSQNSHLKPFIQNGVLDFAIFRPDRDSSIQLFHQKKAISEKTVKNPLVAVANYYFDSIPHDVFYVKDGVLNEVRLTYFRELGEGEFETDPVRLAQIKQFDNFAPVQAKGYYNDPEIDAVLEQYQTELSNAPFLFPIGALRALQNLKKLTKNQFVLLTSDKGPVSVSQLQEQQKVSYMAHGEGFSFEVNFHAIISYLKQGDSRVWHTPDKALTTIFAVPALKSDWEHTQSFLGRAWRHCNPILDFYYSFSLFNTAEATEQTPYAKVQAYCAYIRSQHYDPRTLFNCASELLSLMPQLTSLQQSNLRSVIDSVYTRLQPLPQKPDLIITTGSIYIALAEYEIGRELIDLSIRLNGPSIEAIGLLNRLDQTTTRKFYASPPHIRHLKLG